MLVQNFEAILRGAKHYLNVSRRDAYRPMKPVKSRPMKLRSTLRRKATANVPADDYEGVVGVAAVAQRGSDVQ